MARRIVFEELADRGVWISDDRVNAFVNRFGVAEIGYHGAQPVSRNSRIFAAPRGAFTLWARGRAGAWKRVSFPEALWTPSAVELRGDDTSLLVRARGRSIRIEIPDGRQTELRFGLAARLTNVHGTRTWSGPVLAGHFVELSLRDFIGLRAWVRRTGPYAGDFLIPEPLRRRIFSRRCRSGLATSEDLKPAYRTADIAIYDAEVIIRIGSAKAVVSPGKRCVAIARAASSSSGARVTVSFRDTRDGRAPALRTHTDGIRSVRPTLSFPRYPHIEAFFNEAPRVLESCIVHDHGMPRACAGSYYWIWAWDSMVTAMEWSLTGECERQRDVIRFIDAHRDEGGLIPARWTRDLQPLDTPQRGALDALFAILVHEYFRQSGDRDTLDSVYPALVRHFREMEARVDREGMFATLGFYPDLLAAFGRSEDSAVAMEVGLHFVFCRTMSELAAELGDAALSASADTAAERVKANFLRHFYSGGFLVDSFHLKTGRRSRTMPLFSLLFLRSHYGWELIEPKIRNLAGYISRHHADPHGFRVVPPTDRHAKRESVMSAWYPHWDLYVTRLVRRAQRARDQRHWVYQVEAALRNLGYCPEFLSMDPFKDGDKFPYRHHGAANIANGVSAWYRAIVETITGLECTPDGMRVGPLVSTSDRASLTGLHHLGTIWDVSVTSDLDDGLFVTLDGEDLSHPFDIPRRMFDGGRHRIEIVCGRER